VPPDSAAVMLTAPAPVDTSSLLADRERDVKTAEARETALVTEQKATIDREDKEMKPLEDAASKASGELGGLTPPKPTELPKWEPHPIVDPKDFQSFSFALLGMAMIGGAASRGNWLGVSASLNGALQGYLDGAKDRADREFKDYQTKFKEAQAHDEQAQKEFESILTNKNNTINSMLQQIKIAAAKYGREDIRQAAEQKSIDSIWRQVNATDHSITELEQRHASVLEQFEVGVKRLSNTSGAEGKLNPDGAWFVDQRGVAGDDKPRKELESRYGGVEAADRFNALGAYYRENRLDPREATQAAIDNAVALSTQRQISQRQAGVQRLTGSVQQLEKEVTRLVTKVNGTDPSFLNKPANDLEAAIGSEDVKELQTLMASVGRQYFEAMTMPGSNAQMHASAQDVSDKLADPNISLASLRGLLKGMNFEIQATAKSIDDTMKASQSKVVHHGPTLPVPGAAPQVNSPTATPTLPPSGGGKVVDFNSLPP
jgi:hypothetical protein